MIWRGPLGIDRDELVVTYRVAGPDASVRFPMEHVVIGRPGDADKLTTRGGYGGAEEDGSAFFVWRLEWPGGDEVEIRYVEPNHNLVHRVN